jgi:hypothetical protein
MSDAREILTELAKNAPEFEDLMSQSGWYHDKAAECNRMALASTNEVIRGRYIKDRDSWQEIAARIDAAEEAVKQRKAKE